MILKLALRNIIGNGWRSLINMLILTFVLMGLVWMEGLWYSWLTLAKSQQQQWEFASGMLRAKSYDPFDPFTWEKGFARIPDKAQSLIKTGKVVPILYSPGVIYSQGIQMNAVVKGIPREQTLLRLPSADLVYNEGDPMPVMVGKFMAKSSRLKEGDSFVLRFKDSSGAFNAIDVRLAKIMNCPVPSLDIGTVWMDLSLLQEVKQLPEMTTVLILKDPSLTSISTPAFRSISKKVFFADIDKMVKTKAGAQSSLFIMLIFLAMLAIFDTQSLAIFKRRKEIGTLTALGMTQRQIIRLFTTEGALYMVMATVLTAVLGFPLFWYFAAKGFSLPAGYDNFGVAGFSEPLKFVYPILLIAFTLILLLSLTILVSWLPARKIARMKPTDALRGKAHA